LGDSASFSQATRGASRHTIHVKSGGDEAKFWLDPIGLATTHGFNSRELSEIERLVGDHRPELMEAWDEHLG
jgi:hypothetical protein